jgi:nucleoside-diphosphate-sugar epimerase
MSHEGAPDPSPARVLVTGGSGFIAGHCILQLLEQGYHVRATLRSLAKEGPVRAVLAGAGLADGGRLHFVAADLTRDAGWDEAAAGADFVLHLASPVRPGPVGNADELIVPAREGTLRVLRAARAAGVRRVVLASAFHAVGWGHSNLDHTFTETDWTRLDGPGVDAYGQSKTLAERAAWDFMADPGGSMELATLLPVAVMGPALGREVSGGNHIVEMMLDGKMPGYPNLFIPIVDVRDVAAAHLLAMRAPAAAGERFLLSNGPAIAMREIGATIRANLGEAARRVPTRAIPDLAVRFGALFSPRFRAIAPELGRTKQTSNEKAHRVLGWTPRDPHEAIVAAASSLIAQRAGQTPASR